VTEAIVAALQPALRRAEVERARRAAPEDLTAWALVNRAWVAVQSDLGSREAAESAITACEEALRLDPEYALAHAVLAHARSLLAREGSGGNAAAQASMRRALDLADDDPLIHHCHAALLGNLGRTAEGVRAWERALELDPNNAGARAGLGIARIYMGQHRSGAAALAPRPAHLPLAREPRVRLRTARALGGSARIGRGIGTADGLAGGIRGARRCARLCGAVRRGPRGVR
jgi:tetratricopeptide (TPR) repeat protein